MGSISLGTALVAGRKRVPSPAAGITTLRSGCFMAREPNIGVRHWKGVMLQTRMRLALLGFLGCAAAHAENIVTDRGAPWPTTVDMPRASAMGGAHSAIATSNAALTVNPAGLAQSKRYHFELDGIWDAKFPAQAVIASIV